MNERLDQLHRLLERLERMPASADRDWMLTQIRRRAVDVETGTPPVPVRARSHDELEPNKPDERSARVSPASPRPRKASRRVRRATRVHPAARIPPGPARERRHEQVVDLLEHGGLMSLDEPPPAPGRSWSRGLRG
jgi:hypothetical protein